MMIGMSMEGLASLEAQVRKLAENKLGATEMRKSHETAIQAQKERDKVESLVSKGVKAMSDAEIAELNAVTEVVAHLDARMELERKAEENIARLRASKRNSETPHPVFDRTGGGPYVDQSDWMASQVGGRVNLLKPKLAAFDGGGDRVQAHRDALDSGLWVKATLFHDGDAREKLLSRRGESWMASQNESSPTEGGYLVPAPLERAIITAREQVGALRQLATIYPMTSDSLQIPKQTGGVTVYYPGEEGEITPSDADFGRVSLTPKKRAVLTYVSNELRDDAIIPIVDFLAAEMGHAFGLKEDQEGIVGDGTSGYGGVYGIRPKLIAATAGVSTAATGHDLWAEIDLTDIGKWMSLVADKYRVRDQLKWLCSAAFKFQVFDRLAIGANGALSTVVINGVPEERFLGYPIVISDRMPTTEAAATVCAAFGNFGQAVAMGERAGVRIALSEHVAFTTDRLAVRGVTRYDINVHEAGDTSSAGAIVALKTAS